MPDASQQTFTTGADNFLLWLLTQIDSNAFLTKKDGALSAPCLVTNNFRMSFSMAGADGKRGSQPWSHPATTSTISRVLLIPMMTVDLRRQISPDKIRIISGTLRVGCMQKRR